MFMYYYYICRYYTCVVHMYYLRLVRLIEDEGKII